MIHDIPPPELSPDFTVEDIHKVREWNYERLKDATPEEWSADIKRRADIGRERLGIKTIIKQ
jgi:hypothetical protein